MKRILTNNLLLKIAAIVIAMLLWASVQISEDTVIEKNYNIPINYVNAEYLEQNDLYLKEYPKTVTITVKAKTSAFKNIRSERFTVTADLSKRYGDDLYNKSVSVVIGVDSAIESSILELTCKTGSYLDLVLGNIQEKTFPIQVLTTGELPDGVHLSDQGFTVRPETVTVRGPESIFSRLNQVAAVIDLDEFDGDVFIREVPLALYDNEEKVIETDESVTLSIEQVQITTDILKTKTISISFEGVSGTPAQGYRYSALHSDLEEVEVMGLKTDLAAINNIMIPKEELDITGASEDKVYHIDISRYLPQNITLYGAEKVANVTLSIEQLKEKGYWVSNQNIRIDGTAEQYEYEITTNSVLVTLEGFQEDLDSLSAEELSLSVNVEGLLPGNYDSIPVAVELRDGFRLVNNPKLQMRIQVPETSSEEESVSEFVTEETETESSVGEETETEESKGAADQPEEEL